MNLFYKIAGQISPALGLFGLLIAIWALSSTKRKVYALFLLYFILNSVVQLVVLQPRLIEKQNESPAIQKMIDARAEEMSQVMKKYKDIPMTTGFSGFGKLQYFCRTTAPFVLVLALFFIAYEDLVARKRKTEQDN